MRLADIFCGCGGLTLGAWEAAGRAGRAIDIRFAIDIDKDALAVYRANFSPRDGCIRNAPVECVFDGELGGTPTSAEVAAKRAAGVIDLLLAGPPCQGHSDLNNSTRRNDPRNQLYLRAVRAVEILRPKFALLENVPSVVHDRSGVVSTATAALQATGYHVSTMVVRFLDLGLPQRRRRHILLAAQENVTVQQMVPTRKMNRQIAVSSFLQDLEDEPDLSNSLMARPARMTDANRKRVAYLFRYSKHDLPDRLRPPCHRDKAHTYQSVYGRMHWSEPAQTITTGFGSMGQGRFVHPTRERLITPHEAARLQGFPDFFDFKAASGLTALRRMIGNAVPPPLSHRLVGELLNAKLL